MWDSIITASIPQQSDPKPPMIRLLALVPLLLPLPARALTLDVPGNALMMRQEDMALGSHLLPTGPFADGTLPSQMAEGAVIRQAWQVKAAGLSSLQILQPLRDQLVAAGFMILFECQTDQCGGFDFRFGIEVMQAPDMYVDLGDFRYLSAQADTPDGPEYVSLLVSRTSLAGFLQITRIGPVTEQAALTAVTQAPVRATTTAVPGDFAAEIEAKGRVILSDLTFGIGSAQLGPGPFASLQTLADYLLANPSRRVALVGHTDSQGALDTNIALSKRRAGSVLERLVTDYGIPRNQLDAEGMGFLSPLATNLTPEGRDLNRRVEVIITSTE